MQIGRRAGLYFNFIFLSAKLSQKARRLICSRLVSVEQGVVKYWGCWAADDEVVTDTRVGYWGVMQASVETTKEKQLHNTWVNRIFLQMSHSLLWSKWYQD